MTQIVFLAKCGVTATFRKDLKSVGKLIGLDESDVIIVESGGFLNQEYLHAYERFLKRHNLTIGTEQHAADEEADQYSDYEDDNIDGDDIDDNEMESEEEKDQKKKVNSKDNGERCELPDNCEKWFQMCLSRKKKHKPDLLMGYRKKGSKYASGKVLPLRPKLGSFQKAKSFLKLNDLGNEKAMILRTSANEPGFYGGAVTRSQSKQVNTAPISEKGKSNKLSDPKLGETKQPSNSETNRSSTPPATEIQLEETADNRTAPFEIKPNAIIIGDDAFSILLDADHNKEESASKKSNDMLRLVRHLSGFSEYTSHHGQLHLLISVQEPKLSTGNSLIAQHCRRLKNNFDVVVLFNLQSTSARTFLSSLSTGNEYQELKTIYQYATRMPYTPRVSGSLDQRIGFPYLMFGIKHNTSDPELKYR